MLKRRVNLPEDELRDLYMNQGLTMSEIAARFSVGESSVRRKLHEMGVITRPRGPKGSKESAHLTVTADELRELYVSRKLSIPQIAELYGCANETIRLRLLKFDIPIRSFSQATRVQYGTYDEYKDFSGDPFEKAYLIGFRLGDLHVRREHEGSEVIRVSAGSSRREQVELLEQLFAPYGHIARSFQWRLSMRGILKYENLSISLNSNFEFLLEYPSEIPAWVLAGEDIFFAFFGGFVDAEGSFHLQNRRGTTRVGRFSIKNTDKRILDQCHESLIARGISCSSLTRVYDVGKQTSKRGVFANKALWGFAVEQKESVLRLIEILSPYILHEKRRADMERVRENVEWRNSQEFQQEAERKRLESLRRTNEAKKKNRN